MSKTIEIISKEKIKQIFLDCGVGEKYANEAVDVYDCISLQLTGKKIGKGSELLAISLENPPKRCGLCEGDSWINDMYPVVPYNDSLIVETVRQRYRKYLLCFHAK
tara:strand:- start:65 stop:382 length:318 start_codon:yes stop_codon:yes gene_type:complete